MCPGMTAELLSTGSPASDESESVLSAFVSPTLCHPTMMLTSLPRLTVLPLILIVSTNVLLIAWLYKVFNRPEVPNYLRELDRT